MKILKLKIRFFLTILIAAAPLGVSADIIYFVDGMKTVCLEKAWEENGEVKCEYDGVILSYKKADVVRIEKRRTQKPAAGPAPKPALPQKASTKKINGAANSLKPGALTFYDPRRPQKYWTSASAKHRTFQEAINALAKQYERTPDWIKSHMGETNDLNQIHQNLSSGKLKDHRTVAKAALKSSQTLEFYNPRRAHKYWTSQTAKHNTFNEATAALARQYERTPDWVKTHMGETNDLNQIHQNLLQQKQEENTQ